jgi:hypothetical protein
MFIVLRIKERYADSRDNKINAFTSSFKYCLLPFVHIFYTSYIFTFIIFDSNRDEQIRYSLNHSSESACCFAQRNNMSWPQLSIIIDRFDKWNRYSRWQIDQLSSNRWFRVTENPIFTEIDLYFIYVYIYIFIYLYKVYMHTPLRRHANRAFARSAFYYITRKQPCW